MVALTYVSPSGRPQFSAKKQTLGLDLRDRHFRTVEACGDDGQMFEKIVIDSIAPKSFDDEAFDAKSPGYKFKNLVRESKGEAFREERIKFDSWNSSPIVVSVNSRCSEWLTAARAQRYFCSSASVIGCAGRFSMPGKSPSFGKPLTLAQRPPEP
ncbi:hypothetical protein LMG27952_06023 [Paraburkholderia hiiakae]|uniref:Uncharacterized protein n=1 Tax=Paraburkholderia hiiakae TaxID=1081782 RepID=A0ABM8P4J5_9BURK|nr:hypothetical protein LMG27952_06023 [Paraburkholderia hiiakae]